MNEPSFFLNVNEILEMYANDCNEIAYKYLQHQSVFLVLFSGNSLHGVSKNFMNAVLTWLWEMTRDRVIPQRWKMTSRVVALDGHTNWRDKDCDFRRTRDIQWLHFTIFNQLLFAATLIRHSGLRRELDCI
jgi:hypothetical protein